MSATLNVQTGVPMPEIDRRPKRASKYPVGTMAVGDMFFVAGRSCKSLSAYISRITKPFPERKFSARHCWMVRTGMRGDEVIWTLAKEGDDGAEEGTGVWRTE